MPPKKGTKAYKQEYVTVHYGIHAETLEVRSIYQQRDGTLCGTYGNHYVMLGRDARSEIALVWNIRDVISLPILMDNSSTIEKLKALAEEKRLKRDADAYPNDPN